MQTKIKVAGMHCASCKTLIEDVAGDIPGVQSCTIDLASGDGAINHDETFDFALFVKEIENIDSKYKVTSPS